MNKQLFGVLILTPLIFFAFLGRGEAASQIDALKTAIEQKNQDIKKLESDALKYNNAALLAQKKQKTLKNELKTLNTTIGGLGLTITITGKKIEKVKIEIEKLLLEIKSQEEEVEKNKMALGAVVRTLYEREREDLLLLILKNDSFSDTFNQIQYSENLNNSLFSRLKTILRLKADLELKKEENENNKRGLETLVISLGDQKRANESVKEGKNTLLKKTKNQEAEFQKLLKDTEKKKDETEKDIESLEEKLRLAIDPKSLPPPRPGFFDWPIAGILSSGYGERMHPLGLGVRFHNGIDIAAPIGTPIKSPYDGEVIAIGNSDTYCYRGAYGKWIVIDHGNNLVSMYAHLSLQKIAVGETITRGQVIALVGNTGFSTGSHLHFTIYSKPTLDIRASRVCGILPYGGSVDPMNYLQ